MVFESWVCDTYASWTFVALFQQLAKMAKTDTSGTIFALTLKTPITKHMCYYKYVKTAMVALGEVDAIFVMDLDIYRLAFSCIR